MPDNLYDLDDAAYKLGLSSRTLRRYVEQGKLPNVQRLKSGYIFRDQDILDFRKAYGDPRKRERRVYLKSDTKPKEKRTYNKRKVKGKK